jgi:hypothetical protein
MIDKLEIGTTYMVVKGASLTGWAPVIGGFRGVGCVIEPGDELTYLGTRTIGSDSFPEDYFRCERTGIEGTLPGAWGSADKSYLEEMAAYWSEGGA